jgi:hypothetical protein
MDLVDLGEKKVQTFLLKNWVPVWCIVENYTNKPCDPISKLGTAIEMVS